MRPHDQPAGLCSLDPLSLALGGIATGIGSLFGGSGGGGGSAPAPEAPPPQAPPQKTPQVKPQHSQSTFVGGVPAPPPNVGQKTLLGQ